MTKSLKPSTIKSYTEGTDKHQKQQTYIATHRINWPRGQLSENKHNIMIINRKGETEWQQ